MKQCLGLKFFTLIKYVGHAFFVSSLNSSTMPIQPLGKSLFSISSYIEVNNEVDKESCICKHCEWDFKNGVGNVDYIPRWRAKDVPKCIVDNVSMSHVVQP